MVKSETKILKNTLEKVFRIEQYIIIMLFFLFFVENAAIACHVIIYHTDCIIYKRNVRKYTKKIAPDENSHYTMGFTDGK